MDCQACVLVSGQEGLVGLAGFPPPCPTVVLHCSGQGMLAVGAVQAKTGDQLPPPQLGLAALTGGLGLVTSGCGLHCLALLAGQFGGRFPGRKAAILAGPVLTGGRSGLAQLCGSSAGALGPSVLPVVSWLSGGGESAAALGFSRVSFVERQCLGQGNWEDRPPPAPARAGFPQAGLRPGQLPSRLSFLCLCFVCTT